MPDVARVGVPSSVHYSIAAVCTTCLVQQLCQIVGTDVARVGVPSSVHYSIAIAVCTTCCMPDVARVGVPSSVNYSIASSAPRVAWQPYLWPQ